MKVLVSGIGGDIGFSIGRIIRDSELEVESLIGTDLHDQFYVGNTFDMVEVLPKASESCYLAKLCDLISHRKIDVFVPTSEAELRFIAENGITSRDLGATCITPNPQAMLVGFDKYRTYQHLVENGFPAPWTSLTEDLPEGPETLPCIIKSRTGSGSSAVHIVRTRRECRLYSQLYEHYIWQELVPDHLGEFTCGVYRGADKSTRSIILHRRLTGGLTGYGEVTSNRAIYRICSSLAESLDLHGSINIQLRLLDESTPMIFEINPRFSSTVRMRHKVDFRDVVWSIKEQHLGEEADDYNPLEAEGVIMARRLEEYRIR